MVGDAEVLVARQLTTLLASRGRFEQLQDGYCRVRHHLSPTAALASALEELLPPSEHEVVAALTAKEGDDAPGLGGPPRVHHSLIDGLEDLYEERQTSERQALRETMGVAELAADLAADDLLAAAYREGGHEAAAWLERFPTMVRKRASGSPTPTGRRLTVDQALNALVAAQTSHQARGGDDADAQVAWCVALRDGLMTGSGDRGDAAEDQSFRPRPDDELDDIVDTAPQRPARTTPAPLILDLLRSATSSLEGEDSFVALIEAVNGHDDDNDPTDESTLEAMKSLLEEEVLEPDDSPAPHLDGRVRNELWTHTVFGYRVGRYLLSTHGRRLLSSAPRSPSHASSDLVTYVNQVRQRQDVGYILTAPDFSAALHYHGVSSSLLRAWEGDRTVARASVRLAEDLGFLTAVGEEDLSRGSSLQVDETDTQVDDARVGMLGAPSRVDRYRRSNTGR
jgi:hypothetical protein